MLRYELPDVDLDVADRDAAIRALPELILASQLNPARDDLVGHNTGGYLQHVPVDPISGRCAFPYEIAEAAGYSKIDILPNHVYQGVDHEDHLRDILDHPTDWGMFLDVEFVRSLFHFGGQVDAELSMAQVVVFYEPKSVQDIACLVAMKMPAKRYLIGEPWEVVREKIWIREPKSASMQFRKSHSFSYSLVVIVDAKLKRYATEI